MNYLILVLNLSVAKPYNSGHFGGENLVLGEGYSMAPRPEAPCLVEPGTVGRPYGGDRAIPMSTSPVEWTIAWGRAGESFFA